MLNQPPLDEHNPQLKLEVVRLRQEVEDLKQANRDLYLALTTTAEHGDLVEAQLQAANDRLQVEVKVRQRAEATLKTLIEMVSKRKADLEIVVQTIMEHGDVMDYQWAQKLSAMNAIASIDGLTQIPNRRRFDEHLHHQWQQMAHHQEPLALILCDIDQFKQYNDTYGHLVGDQCLQQVATVLARSVNHPQDLAARFGGEEFAVILPQTTLHGATSVARRIQIAIAQLNILHQSSTVSPYVTLSMGIASCIPQEQTSCLTLVDQADQHLYIAKQAGRNRIISHPDQFEPLI